MKIPYLFLCYFPMGYVNNYHQERKNVIMELPEDLRYAIELELSHFSPKKLSKIVSDLSNRYRTRKEPRGTRALLDQKRMYTHMLPSVCLCHFCCSVFSTKTNEGRIRGLGSTFLT